MTGPIIGLCLFARTATESVGLKRDLYNKIQTFTFLGQALIEAPILFGFLIAILMSSITISATSPFFASIKALLAAGAMGLSTLGAGIGSGITAATACQEFTKKPSSYTPISRISILIQTVIDTSALYGFVIALFLIMFTK